MNVCTHIHENVCNCAWICIGLMRMFRCVIFQLKTFSHWTVSSCCGWCGLHIDKWKSQILKPFRTTRSENRTQAFFVRQQCTPLTQFYGITPTRKTRPWLNKSRPVVLQEKRIMWSKSRFIEALRKVFEENLRGYLSNLEVLYRFDAREIRSMMFAVDSLILDTTYKFGGCLFCTYTGEKMKASEF